MRYLVGFLCVCALGVVPLVGCSDDLWVCENAAEGTPCANGAGTCQQGSCEVACTEQGIRDAIAAGGGPYAFACNGPTTIVTEAEIIIDNNVTLEGEGNLIVEGNRSHRVFFVAERVTAEIGGFTIAKGGSPGNEGGGGIDNHGTLKLTNSTVSGNTAPFGGGIYNHGTLKLTNSTVSGNTEYSGGGGGIDNHGTLTLTNSTVSDNLAASNGGGINNRRDGGVTTLINSTVSGNTGEYYGGGINNVGTLTLTSSTVSGNTASIFGNIYNGDTATLTNTVIDGDCWGDITSNGYNIESPGDTCGFDQTGDLVNITEGQLDLGELANNGGPTMTHALGADSVAIDHIPAVDCEVDKDQRDQPRPETGGTMCDVGSVEVQP